ncbi:hypothetical protein [Candidatus Nitrospira bockiana]
MGTPRTQEGWPGEEADEWIGAEGAVGLGPGQRVPERIARARARQAAWLLLSCAFVGGLAIGSAVCGWLRRPSRR